jgi:hypothetical protein
MNRVTKEASQGLILVNKFTGSQSTKVNLHKLMTLS